VEDVVTGVTDPRGIALDLVARKVYWTSEHANKIQRANLDGTGVQDLVAGLSLPRGIALDVGGGTMYWADDATNKIYKANLDGSGMQDLVTGLGAPRGVALDLAGGKVYWSATSVNKIQRAKLDGTGVEDVIVGVGVGFGLALDVTGGKVYWTTHDKIRRANLDGTGVQEIVTGLEGAWGLALDLSPDCPTTFDFDFSGTQYADCFREVHRGGQIDAGLDVGGTGHDSLVFTGLTGAGGATWLTVYDATPLNAQPGPTFGAQTLCADVLFARFNNMKGAGLVALLNEGAGKKGLALVVSDAGNTDLLRLVTIDGDPTKQGKFTVLEPHTVKLKNGIAENVWYRLIMTVDPAVPRVTGQVFTHALPLDPDSPLGVQVGSTLTYEPAALPSGVATTGQNGILAQAVSAVVDLSVTNFSNDPALCLPAPVACDPAVAPGCELNDGEPSTSLAGAVGSQKHFFIDVPAGLPNLTVQISGGTGDVDLYVKFGAAPTLSSYDCRPYLNGNSETCTFSNPAAGRWHIMLNAYSSYSGVTLVAND
jgi:hypothetical protein